MLRLAKNSAVKARTQALNQLKAVPVNAPSALRERAHQARDQQLHDAQCSVKPESLKVAHVIHGAWGVEAPGGFLTVVFAAHEWTGEPENREPRKHSQVRWVDASAIPEAFVDTTASALHGYLSGRCQVSLDGWR